MTNLKAAHNELFKRGEDETFETFEEMYDFCAGQRERGRDIWRLPQETTAAEVLDGLNLEMGTDGSFLMNDWSFSQLCRLSGVAKDTLNRLSPSTASLVLKETSPNASKPIQFLADANTIRSIHGTQYTRVWNAELLEIVRDASDFVPPQKAAIQEGTGLYAGEQDMFCFMIDPTGWVEIEDEAFAPGFFVWNSEVGRRTLGCQTFWFQAACANHIVWDAVEVVDFKRKHTASVGGGLLEIRRIIGELAKKRDARKDGFFAAIKKAMTTKLGDDAEAVMKELERNGIPKKAAKAALKIAEKTGSFSIFSLVDALTRTSSGNLKFAGDRVQADQQAAKLLSLAM